MTGVHAIAGLPRSGSTLLSAVLRQNPKFYAGATSPIYSMMVSLIEQMSSGREFDGVFDDARRARMLRGLFDNFYSGCTGKTVFDTNRMWPCRASLLHTLYPNSRIICCVRDVGWIVDSIERMLRVNPLQTSRIFNFKATGTIYSRVQVLMSADTGLIGTAWSALHEAWHGDEANRLIVVRYESLTRDPRGTIEAIYNELGEEPFEHDYNNLKFEEREYDLALGMPGLHSVRGVVSVNERTPIIPTEIFRRHAELAFWNKSDANTRGVLVI